MSFYIENKKFNYTRKITNNFFIKSTPHDYEIEIINSSNLLQKFKGKKNVFLIDESIKKLYFKKLPLDAMTIRATEKNKNIKKAIEIINFFERKNITKLNNIIVVGGGILQDLGAFACSMYKRGIPWTYVPTTMLGMTDSCVGGKTGLNFTNKKNMLALFSAPRKVLINLKFLDTLPEREFISGLGESLRLHITGGKKFINIFENNIDLLLKRDKKALKKIIQNSLIVKKSVVEIDEFEKNYRKSMNYGHSIGHALESLTNFSFPHGMAVSLGMMIENNIASMCYDLDYKFSERVNKIIRKLIDKRAIKDLNKVKEKNFVDVLKSDKKVLGNILKLSVPGNYGKMYFKDFHLHNKNNNFIVKAINSLYV